MILSQSQLSKQGITHLIICDFESNWANGLSVHMSRKHAEIEQLVGGNSVSDDNPDNDDDKYLKTIQYWHNESLELCSKCSWMC